MSEFFSELDLFGESSIYSRCKYIDGLPFEPWESTLECKPDCLIVQNLDVPYFVDYINKNSIKKVRIKEMDNFEFLRECPSIEYINFDLQLQPDSHYTAKKRLRYFYKEYNFDPLYEIPHVKGIMVNNREYPYVKAKIQIDLKRLPELELYYGDADNVVNLAEAYSLKSLYLNDYKGRDLQEISGLYQLDALQIQTSSIRSLDGIQHFSGLKLLNLYYNRYLEDISQLEEIKKTLQVLNIDSCSRIKELMVIRELTALVDLQVEGKMKVADLGFIKNLKLLKRVFLDINVLNGDLTPLMTIPYATIQANRRHFNLKNKDLPKGECKIGAFDDADRWRIFY